MSYRNTLWLAGALALASLGMTTPAAATTCVAPIHCLCDGTDGIIFTGDVVEETEDGVRIVVDRIGGEISVADPGNPALQIGSEVEIFWEDAIPDSIIGQSTDGGIEQARALLPVADETVTVCNRTLTEERAFELMSARNCPFTAEQEEGIEPPSGGCGDGAFGCAVADTAPGAGGDPLPLLCLLALGIITGWLRSADRARSVTSSRGARQT